MHMLILHMLNNYESNHACFLKTLKLKKAILSLPIYNKGGGRAIMLKKYQ